MKGRVSPFGNPRINGCSPLLAAYRSVLRPSSPLSAKAFTRCPYLALDPKANASRTETRSRGPGLTGMDTIASATQHFFPQTGRKHSRTTAQLGLGRKGEDHSSCRAERPACDQPHHLSTMSNSRRPAAKMPRHQIHPAFAFRDRGSEPSAGLRCLIPVL